MKKIVRENNIDKIKKPKDNDLMGRFVWPSLFENDIDKIKLPKENDLMGRFVFPSLIENEQEDMEKAIMEGKCPSCRKKSFKEYKEIEPGLFECPECQTGYDAKKDELLEGRLFRKRVFEACEKKGAK